MSAWNKFEAYYCPQCRAKFDQPVQWVSPCCGAEISDTPPEAEKDDACAECGDLLDGDVIIPKCPKCGNEGGGRHVQPDYGANFSDEEIESEAG